MRLWRFDRKKVGPYSWERHFVAAVDEFSAIQILIKFTGNSEETIKNHYLVREIPMVGIVYSDVY